MLTLAVLFASVVRFDRTLHVWTGEYITSSMARVIESYPCGIYVEISLAVI